jgi:hypothetical protein
MQHPELPSQESIRSGQAASVGELIWPFFKDIVINTTSKSNLICTFGRLSFCRVFGTGGQPFKSMVNQTT